MNRLKISYHILLWYLFCTYPGTKLYFESYSLEVFLDIYLRLPRIDIYYQYLIPEHVFTISYLQLYRSKRREEARKDDSPGEKAFYRQYVSAAFLIRNSKFHIAPVGANLNGKV